ncbi:competence damage-inducible protein A [Porphyromonas macacae]|uniref:Competence damage-inducible protein A n=1 Tax=Porphyromonas macacae TaxID=28115 RepID=A0A379E9R0_9PORP|nr:CinA family protein [Porphyromonas macacae]SUB89405.1 competence damage-inducible protein A [Porphyromonas macacae]
MMKTTVIEALNTALSIQLMKYGLKIGTAESCTGGMIGNTLASIAGASRYYAGSIVSYSEDVKQSILGVHEDTLARYTAVSSQVAEEMAKCVFKLLRTDVAISTTGYAGPSGGTEVNPVGTVYSTIGLNGKLYTYRLSFTGSRQHIIEETTIFILRKLIEIIRNQLKQSAQ